MGVILTFSYLRLPILITFLLPFCMLIASLLTFGRLHRSSELVAIQALGMPFHRILGLLLPCALVLVGLHFLISDQLTPKATRALAAWEKETKTRRPNDIALWLRDGPDVVSIGDVHEQGEVLEDVVIFRRDAAGNLVRQESAKNAVFGDQGWQLVDIDDLEIRPSAKFDPNRVQSQPWDTALRPDVIGDLATAPDALSIAEIQRLLELPEITSRPLHIYRTWLHKSFATPLASLFMVVLATASVRGLQRQGGAALNALIGFGGAFLYFVADGVLTAFGEAGALNPLLAAWLPLLLLALAAAAVLYWVTMPRGRRKAKSLAALQT
jgi:lipopolysaccharide export system permease protein